MDVQLNSERIRDEREQRAWTQEQLAELAGLGVRTVQRIEAGGPASLESAAALSSVLSVPLAELRAKADDRRIRQSRLRLGLVDVAALMVGIFGVMLFSPAYLLPQVPLILIVAGAYLFGRLRFRALR